MKQSDNKRNNNIWKLLLLVLEVMAIIVLVWILFAHSWVYRPHKFQRYKNLIRNQELYFQTDESTSYDVLELEMPTDPKPIEETTQPNEPSNDILEPTFEETIASYVFDICQSYPTVDPYIVLSVIYQESRFTPNVSSGNCVGLMQVSTYWHSDRAARLGVSDFYDPYSNILVGVDLLNELLESSNGDIYRALTRYNGGSTIGRYANEVVNRANEYREVDIYGSKASSS